MSSKSLSLLFLTLSILVSFVSASKLGVRVGGWKPIKNPNDPKIVEIGKFAVTEHDKKVKAALGFGSVVRGEMQVVEGVNYKLVLTAKNGGSTLVKTYEAVVWDKPWQKFRQLISFKEIKG